MENEKKKKGNERSSQHSAKPHRRHWSSIAVFGEFHDWPSSPTGSDRQSERATQVVTTFCFCNPLSRRQCLARVALPGVPPPHLSSQFGVKGEKRGALQVKDRGPVDAGLLAGLLDELRMLLKSEQASRRPLRFCSPELVG